MTLEVIFSAASQTGFINNYNAEIWQNIVFGILTLNIPIFIELFSYHFKDDKDANPVSEIRKSFLLKKYKLKNYFFLILGAIFLPICVGFFDAENLKFIWFIISSAAIIVFLCESFKILKKSLKDLTNRTANNTSGFTSDEIPLFKELTIKENRKILLEFYQGIFAWSDFEDFRKYFPDFFKIFQKHLEESASNGNYAEFFDLQGNIGKFYSKKLKKNERLDMYYENYAKILFEFLIKILTKYEELNKYSYNARESLISLLQVNISLFPISINKVLKISKKFELQSLVFEYLFIAWVRKNNHQEPETSLKNLKFKYKNSKSPTEDVHWEFLIYFSKQYFKNGNKDWLELFKEILGTDFDVKIFLISFGLYEEKLFEVNNDILNLKNSNSLKQKIEHLLNLNTELDSNKDIETLKLMINWQISKTNRPAINWAENNRINCLTEQKNKFEKLPESKAKNYKIIKTIIDESIKILEAEKTADIQNPEQI